MSELKAQAEELGIKVDGRWSDERIQEEIDNLGSGEEVEISDKVYSKSISGKFDILGVEIGENFTPSEAHKDNKRFMDRLNHAVKCGVVNEHSK